MKKLKGHIDWYILIPVVALMLFSIAFVYSASATIAEVRFGSSEKFLMNHLVRVLLAFVAIFVCMKIDYHRWQRFSFPIIILAFISLIAVFVVGTKINNAYRWLYIGPLNFQPSELAKFALVLHISSLLAARQELIKDFKLGLMPILLWIVSACALIALQPNFSTATLIFVITLMLLFIGNTNAWHLVLLSLGTIFIGLAYAMMAPYRRYRIFSFFGIDSPLSASASADPENYQAQQAVLAFGNGGIFGVGPGESRQSHLFLPESFGDFIFSIIGEEYGLVGTTIIILVFAFILFRGLKIARNAPDLFGYFLSSGIIITISLYAFVSAAVNCGLLPTTGLPMPFVSYGGTAVIFYGVAIGILLNISAQSGVFPRKELNNEDA